MTHHALACAPTFDIVPAALRTLTPVPRHVATPCVLVVDASPLFRQAVCSVLELAGYGVLLADNAQECLHLLGRHDVSALMVDSSLPDMDGPQLVQCLRCTPAFARIPCLLLSRSDDRHDEVRGLEAGADDFIRKSEGLLVLEYRLRAHLRRKAAEDEARAHTEGRHQRELQQLAARAAREADQLRSGLRATIEGHAAEVERLRQPDAMHTCPDLLSELSDALREPLHAIVGFAELLRDELFGLLGNRQRDCVRRILEGGHAQLGLVNALIDLTHLETGRLCLARSPVSLGLLADAVAGVLRSSAVSRQVQIHLSVPEDLPLAFADPTRIRQVLHSILTMSLCDAGLDATLHLQASACGHGLEVTVTRAGPAMARDEEEPGAATARRLTFAVARRLAELHGGSLGAAEEGAVLTLRLPAVLAG